MSMRGLLAVAFVVVLAGCGSAGGSTAMSAPETAASTMVPLDPIETIVPPTSDPSVPWPEQVRWLAPPDEVAGMRLVEARRELVAGCGPDSDCALTVPSATLAFDTDDLATARSIHVRQTLPDPGSYSTPAPTGERRIVGQREVVVDEQGDPDASYVAAVWSEPGGIEVEVQAVHLPWADVEAFIASLQPTDAASWPGIEVSGPHDRCVGERTQYGPAGVPDGWTRFVLDAAPVGACNVESFLFMSLVIPGTVDEPGTLVTFVTSPAGTAGDVAGDAVDINGVSASLEQSVQADGLRYTALTMQLGDASISAHGNVEPATLIELMETVRLLDDAEWSQLVSEIDSG